MATKRPKFQMPSSHYDRPKTPSCLPENIDRENLTESDRELLVRRLLASTFKDDVESEYDPSRDEPSVINFEQLLLVKIEAAAATSGITRDAWIANACSRALDLDNF